MTQTSDIEVPDIGDFKNIPVIEVRVKPGDAIAVDDTLIVLESDKATLDVPSPSAGVVREVRLGVGDLVSRGTVVISLEHGAAPETDAQAKVAPLPAVAAAPVSSPAPAAPPPITPAPLASPPTAAVPTAIPAIELASGLPPHASPSVRQYARELGVDLARVAASGPKGRVTREDVQGFVKEVVAAPRPAPAAASASVSGLALLPWPQIDFSQFGPIERVALTKIRRISGANLARNAVVIPHVTNFDETDVTELEAFRLQVNGETKSGVKLTMLAFMIKAMVRTLQQFPAFNASLDGEELILKRFCNIGFAADTPNGLVVPVIRDADRKGVVQLAEEASKLAASAREGKLKPADMQGGCITISSLGGIGGTGFTPIINAPEVAILGAARAQMKPVWDGTEFKPRLIMPVSLSWDHRVTDGAAAARFLAFLSACLADMRRLIL